MKASKSTTPALVADPSRGEVVLTLAGRPRLIRFSLRFLKALTDKKGVDNPVDALEKLQTAPITALLEMAAVGIQLCVPAHELPADFDAELALDELPNSEQAALFSVLMNAVTQSPLLAALTQTKAA